VCVVGGGGVGVGGGGSHADIEVGVCGVEGDTHTAEFSPPMNSMTLW